MGDEACARDREWSEDVRTGLEGAAGRWAGVLVDGGWVQEWRFLLAQCREEGRSAPRARLGAAL